MSKIYFHIGNPKAYSTSIQKLLSECNSKDLEYIGFKPEKSYEKWYTDGLSSNLLDFDLRFSTNQSFEKKIGLYEDYILENFNNCKKDNKDLWISSETAVMKYLLEDIDIYEKFSRVQRIVPPKTVFIIIFRNIWDSLKSIYKEFVKQRYTLTFNQYCEEIFLYRDANFLFSLMPGHLLTYLNNIMINDNELYWYFIEKSDSSDDKLINFLNQFRKTTKFSKLPYINLSFNDISTEQLRKMNAENQSFVDQSGLIENHRSLWYNNKVVEHSFDDYLFWKLKMQNKNRKLAIINSSSEHNIKIPKSYLLKYLNDIKKIDKEKYSLLIQQGNIKSNIDHIWEL